MRFCTYDGFPWRDLGFSMKGIHLSRHWFAVNNCHPCEIFASENRSQKAAAWLQLMNWCHITVYIVYSYNRCNVFIFNMSLQNIMTWGRPKRVCLKTSNESTVLLLFFKSKCITRSWPFGNDPIWRVHAPSFFRWIETTQNAIISEVIFLVP